MLMLQVTEVRGVPDGMDIAVHVTLPSVRVSAKLRRMDSIFDLPSNTKNVKTHSESIPLHVTPLISIR